VRIGGTFLRNEPNYLAVSEGAVESHLELRGSRSLTRTEADRAFDFESRRETQAIHAKLDELLRANGEARNQLTHLEEPEQVGVFRSKASN
jgi:low affinity Fe/Cu permease